VEDKLAEIAVGNDQNPFLFPGDCKDVLIGKTGRIVTRDDMNVMSELAKVRNKSEVGALVEQEWAYLLVGGGHYVWEEAIESLVNPRQSEMKPMIEPHFAPAHTHPFEALLNQPLTGTFH